ncbi:MAG: VWA domain-containing protein [Chlorobi bacterium]|nr:VWA domain-containing protein [Chlorobiota bacterium]
MMDDDRLRSARAHVEEDPLFAEFELAGLIGWEVVEQLPQHVWLIFECARVIESTDTALGARLAPLIQRRADNREEPPSLVPTVAAEEYEADLIRHFHELPLIYPYQFLLPEEVFYQRLAERSLWLPRPVPPRLYRYPTASDTFAPDPRKQKVYILFDVSRSMNSHWRIVLAKAIAYVFLQQNMRELGTVYLRTFAESVGERFSAEDVPSFLELIRRILFATATGRGTNMQQAIEVAIDDIRSHHTLSDAEILVITDGAAHLDVERLTELMSDSIALHAVKIGHERIAADPAMVEYYARKLGTADARRLLDLQERRRQLQLELHHANTAVRRSMLSHEINVLDRVIAEVADRLAQYATEHFGTDIEQLADIFVQLDDLDPMEAFRLSPQRKQQLEQLTRALLDEFAALHRSEDAERIAALLEHMRELLQFNPDATPLHELVQEMETSLRQWMRSVRSGDTADVAVAPPTPTIEHVRMAIGRSRGDGLSFGALLRILWRRLVRWVQRRRQVRIARILLRRRWRRR